MDPAPDGIPVIDVLFDLRGRALPAEHGYALYSALCAVAPALHGARWLAIHPVLGRIGLHGRISLSHRSALVLRLPAPHLGATLELMEREIRVDGEPLLLGTPRVRPLRPAQRLDSRLVVVRLTKAPLRPDRSIDKGAFSVAFRAEIDRQLERLAVKAPYELGAIREVRVGGQRVLGHLVAFRDLSDLESISLQRCGLGGKHRMGCGVFIPSR